MDPITISNVEYMVPMPDHPVGSVSFSIKALALHSPKTKMIGDKEATDTVFSEATLALAKQLSESIIQDLEK